MILIFTIKSKSTEVSKINLFTSPQINPVINPHLLPNVNTGNITFRPGKKVKGNAHLQRHLSISGTQNKWLLTIHKIATSEEELENILPFQSWGWSVWMNELAFWGRSQSSKQLLLSLAHSMALEYQVVVKKMPNVWWFSVITGADTSSITIGRSERKHTQAQGKPGRGMNIVCRRGKLLWSSVAEKSGDVFIHDEVDQTEQEESEHTLVV